MRWPSANSPRERRSGSAICAIGRENSAAVAATTRVTSESISGSGATESATTARTATEGSRIEWRVAPPEGVRGRAVLVLDDILDGGHTLAAIREKVLALGATSFQCAVLVEKKLARPKPIRADFVGLEIPDRFVFGCGMDAKGFWRNLPEIRAMKE